MPIDPMNTGSCGTPGQMTWGAKGLLHTRPSNPIAASQSPSTVLAPQLSSNQMRGTPTRLAAASSTSWNS